MAGRERMSGFPPPDYPRRPVPCVPDEPVSSPPTGRASPPRVGDAEQVKAKAQIDYAITYLRGAQRRVANDEATQRWLMDAYFSIRRAATIIGIDEVGEADQVVSLPLDDMLDLVGSVESLSWSPTTAQIGADVLVDALSWRRFHRAMSRVLADMSFSRTFPG